ncbi:TetR/AcrR family transcriptional regulator [Pseudodesulfovibrio piezophilus]|nr:CerR family C-terminal domain-containing protein [Pseudodesulfovibrio piezophilus]
MKALNSKDVMVEKERAVSRKVQGEETRALLIDVGARLFGLHGFHGVSMRQLAAEAGVNLSTVGYHFGGKAGLYEAILQELIAMRDEIFPPIPELEKRLSEAAGNANDLAEVVSWYMNRLVHGILGQKRESWPAFIISRELAQSTELYPKIEKEFFDPTFSSLFILVDAVLPDVDDREEIVITSHCIIGMIIKFLESHKLITKRLNWESYRGRGVEKISVIMSKRIRGFLGLPMENA